jgi:hypothetical protein
MRKLEIFEKEIAEVLNKHGIDSQTKTPDFILASYITKCIAALKAAKIAQETHERK